MNITLPMSDTERHIQSIRRAVDHTVSEIDAARRKLADLEAELRGLQYALELVSPKPST